MLWSSKNEKFTLQPAANNIYELEKFFVRKTSIDFVHPLLGSRSYVRAVAAEFENGEN